MSKVKASRAGVESKRPGRRKIESQRQPKEQELREKECQFPIKFLGHDRATHAATSPCVDSHPDPSPSPQTIGYIPHNTIVQYANCVNSVPISGDERLAIALIGPRSSMSSPRNAKQPIAKKPHFRSSVTRAPRRPVTTITRSRKMIKRKRGRSGVERRRRSVKRRGVVRALSPVGFAGRVVSKYGVFFGSVKMKPTSRCIWNNRARGRQGDRTSKVKRVTRAKQNNGVSSSSRPPHIWISRFKTT